MSTKPLQASRPPPPHQHLLSSCKIPVCSLLVPNSLHVCWAHTLRAPPEERPQHVDLSPGESSPFFFITLEPRVE